MGLQQDFLRNQGRKGFRFHGDVDDYPALLIKYEEKTKIGTSDEEHFNIRYTLLEGEPEKVYKRQLVIKDKLEALKSV